MATQPIPPSDRAIFSVGYRKGYPDQSQWAHEVSAEIGNNVEPSCRRGTSDGRLFSGSPDEPTWRQITVSVSTQASMIGSHQPELSDGRPRLWGCSGKDTA